MAKLNFENLSREDKEALIYIADRINSYKEACKKDFSIAENQREFDEYADNFCTCIFYSLNIFDFKLVENDNEQGAN